MKLQNGTKNTFELIGRLKEVPKFNESEYGKIGSITLITERFVKKDVIETDFHNVLVTNRVAEFIEKYGHPGKRLLVSGYMKNSHYEDAEGETKYLKQLVCQEFMPIDRFLNSDKSNSEELENE